MEETDEELAAEEVGGEAIVRIPPAFGGWLSGAWPAAHLLDEARRR
jgi:hypothetical protein